jgi:molybdenum cofactor cytidylyltransferase
LVDSLIAAFEPAKGRSICLPVFCGTWGNPVLWARCYLAEMEGLTGDAGAKGLLQTHIDEICEIAAPDDAVLADIDTAEAFATLKP